MLRLSYKKFIITLNMNQIRADKYNRNHIIFKEIEKLLLLSISPELWLGIETKSIIS